MDFPERFAQLPPYAFPRLRALLGDVPPGGPEVAMTVGEPRHPFPDWVGTEIAAHAEGFGRYPLNEGTPALLEAIDTWLLRRYGVAVGPDRIMALNGTREGLFNTALALSPETKNGQRPAILIPNPFYQVYAVAAAALGAEPVFVPATEETGFLPDYAGLSPDILDRTTLAYICSPANPQGAVARADYLADLLHLAEMHDFIVLSDECYSEIWREAPPPGLLQVAASLHADPERAVVFHSLSKRSSVPGLRSGFVAGGAGAMKRVRNLRSFAGAPLPPPIQHVSALLWAEEDHVDASRALYQDKFVMAEAVLGDVPRFTMPEAGFFLWVPVGARDGFDAETACLRLWRETGVRTLPGHYLALEVDGETPGRDRLRVALVAPIEECEDGLTRLRACLFD